MDFRGWAHEAHAEHYRGAQKDCMGYIMVYNDIYTHTYTYILYYIILYIVLHYNTFTYGCFLELDTLKPLVPP